jgi:hypothetical protein
VRVTATRLKHCRREELRSQIAVRCPNPRAVEEQVVALQLRGKRGGIVGEGEHRCTGTVLGEPVVDDRRAAEADEPATRGYASGTVKSQAVTDLVQDDGGEIVRSGRRRPAAVMPIRKVAAELSYDVLRWVELRAVVLVGQRIDIPRSGTRRAREVAENVGRPGLTQTPVPSGRN